MVVVADPGSTHLGECLRSVLASSYRPEEVLLADEGAGDGALPQPGVDLRRVTRVPGPAAVFRCARQARGELLLFVDADDVLPAEALRLLVDSMAASGSEVAVGLRSEVRAGRRRRQVDPDLPQPGRRLPADAVAQLLTDTAPTGRLFSAEAWLRAADGVPDVPGGPGALDAVVARVLATADGVDLVAEVVYELHDRQRDRPVLEQDRFRAGPAAGRLAAWAAVRRELHAVSPRLAEDWTVDVVTHRVPPVARDAVAAPELVEVLGAAVRETWSALPAAARSRVPLEARLVAHLAATGHHHDLAALLTHLADHPHGLPVEETEDGDLLAVLPDGLVAAVPPGVRRVEPTDRRLHSRVSVLVRDGRLEVRGAAFLDYDTAVVPPVVEVRTPAGDVLPCEPVAVTPDPALNVWAARAHEDHAACGFAAIGHEAPAAAGTGRWTVTVRVAGQQQQHLVTPRSKTPEEQEVRVTGLGLDRGEVLLWTAGPRSGSGPVHVRLSRGTAGGPGARVPDDGGPVRLPATEDLFGDLVPLPVGGYAVQVAGSPAGAWRAAVLGPDVTEAVDGRLRITPAPAEAPARLRVDTPLSAATRSPFGQQQLRDGYTRTRRGPRRRTVLVETFRGRSAGDSPGAVGRLLSTRSREEGLDLEVVVVVDDPSVTVPAGTTAVFRGSPAWYDTLAGAAVYVSNAAAPPWFVKAPGQLHVQTWHGTPLKRIGADRGPGDFATWRHRRVLAGQAAGWDAMVSAGSYVSGIYRSAFGFEGPALEVGYPRNDVLVAAGARERGARVRARLGVRPDQRVVLYAPTWREHLGVRDAKPLLLDAEQLVGAAPDTVVLVRGHYNGTRQDDLFRSHPRILDVTRFPDVADLFLAADALVTDYSSVMFDFALTDRPQVLLVPDLERYREVERGFYLDLDRHAPGPLVTSTAEVWDVLRGPDEHGAARAALRTGFCAHDDGHATERVVDFVLDRL